MDGSGPTVSTASPARSNDHLSRHLARRRSVLTTQYSVLILFLLAACALPLGGGSGAPPARITYVTPDNAIAVTNGTRFNPSLSTDELTPATATHTPNQPARLYDCPTGSAVGRRVAIHATDDHCVRGTDLVAGLADCIRVTILKLPAG